ncbi:hypothetical protein OROMI_001671 [Orobanche minor]
MFSKIWPSREILKIRDGTLLEKRVARILFSKIRPSREILKIRDGTPLEKKRVARIMFSKIRPSREILKIRDGTLLEAEEILTYIKSSRNGSVCYFSSKLDVPSNVVQKKRVARILFSKIRPSREILKIRDPFGGGGNFDIHKKALKTDRFVAFLASYMPSREILKIRDGTPLEAEDILTYIKKLSKRIENLKIRDVARIMFSKIRPSREILKIRDGTLLEAEEILTYIKKLSKRIVARILFSKIRPSREILKIRDGTLLEAEEILTYIKKLSKRIVARILFSKIRPSRENLKIRDGTHLEAEEILTYIKKLSKRIVARIMFSKIRPSRENLKIRDGTLLEAEEILTYIKSSRNGSVCYFSSKLDVPSNVVQKKRVARILFSKIRPSREILKIRDGTPLEAEEILTYIKKLSKRIGLPSRENLKIRDGTHLEAEEILTYIKKLSKRIGLPSREILKIRDGTLLEKKRVARIMFSKIRPSREILKIRDGTLLEAEEILTYIKISRNGSVCYFSSKLDVPSNVVQKKRVARIMFSKIRPSREILKIRDGTPLEAEEILTYIKKLSKRIGLPSRENLKIRDGTHLEAEEILTYIKKLSKRIGLVARIMFSKIRPSREILKIRDGTLLEAEEILTYIKSSRNGSVCYFSSKLDVPSNVVQKKRVARILFSKIRPSREILKIRDGTPLEAEEILTYIKKLSKRIAL